MKRSGVHLSVGLALLLLLSACGREASVTLNDPARETASAADDTSDPNDNLETGAPAVDETDADGAQGSGTDASKPTSGSASASPGRVHATPGQEEPRQGIDVGEPNPGAPECPECEPGSGPGAPDPEPRPNPYTTPSPGQEDVRARPWESAEVHPDDVTVTVTWWSGVEPCHVLDRVEVREESDFVMITLYEGQQPGFSGACTAQAVQKRTQITLSAPLDGRRFVDGAAPK